ncbi:cation/H(+) antiporter 15 [Elaeis guineensis]|uniref:Cation/H(+) antiporter 15-like n=1 Tax=Elaeis guineensis var. tenera TaxID=51953 RepID=A0A6I9RVV0_ELAGV|nr:cation/H(+) antiporter 15-like [Elaeis guineensis]
MGDSIWYCYWPEGIKTPPSWKSTTILTDFMLPAYLVQLVVVIVTIQTVEFLLKPLHQPRIVAEILSGVLLGPSVLGYFFPNVHRLPPEQNYFILSTVGNFALLFYVFMVGLELDVNALRELRKKALTLAVAGMALPFVVSSAATYLLDLHSLLSRKTVKPVVFYIFFGITVSISGFPVLARMITELKLLNSSVGPVAMASSIISSMLSFMLLAICLAFGVRLDQEASLEAAVWAILSSAGFLIGCFFVVRPAVRWMLGRRAEGDERGSEMEMGVLLAGAAAAGFIADVIGMNWVFGAFAYGLAIPNGPLATALIQRLELFMVHLMMPLFFFCSGLVANLQTILSPPGAIRLVAVFAVTVLVKVLGTVLAAYRYSIPLHESLTLGFLAIAKGPLHLIILKVGKDAKIVLNDFFTVMTVASALATAVVAPLVTWTYKPTRPLIGHRRRQLERSRPDAELRMVACVHSTRHVHSITRLLDFSNPTKRSPIFVCALHLVELTGRASAMLIMHHGAGADQNRGDKAHPHGQAQSESIIAAFHSYEQHAAGVSIQTLTAFSSPNTMHEDVCSLAEERRASLIVLPFHKHPTADGQLVEGSPNVRTVNQNILSDPPCSVALFVDRSPGGARRFCAHHSVAAFFFSGPDDREALAYAARMAEHPAVNLTVVRFVEGATSLSTTPLHDSSEEETLERDAQRMRDDEMLNEFRLRFVSNETVLYTEKVVSNSEDTVAVVRSMEAVYDLYVVGRGRRVASPLTAGLEEWTECPELGPIGDLLISPDFRALVSVLVVQQHAGNGTATDRAEPPQPVFQNFQ